MDIWGCEDELRKYGIGSKNNGLCSCLMHNKIGSFLTSKNGMSGDKLVLIKHVELN